MNGGQSGIEDRFTGQEVIICGSLLQLADEVSGLEVLESVGRCGYGDRGKDRSTRDGEERDEEC